MVWIAVAAGALGAASSAQQSRYQKKMAAKQAALAKKHAEELRRQATVTRHRLGREIEAMRVMRSMDMPGFQQAAQTAMLQAQKGSERMARHRMMGGFAPEVRNAIFGGQFQQYVGRELQQMQKQAALTQQIFNMTATQQQQVNALMSQASSVSMEGQSQAIQMEAAAGDETATIMGAVAQAAGQYAGAKSAKEAQAEKAAQASYVAGTPKGGYTAAGRGASVQANPGVAEMDWWKGLGAPAMGTTKVGGAAVPGVT